MKEIRWSRPRSSSLHSSCQCDVSVVTLNSSRHGVGAVAAVEDVGVVALAALQDVVAHATAQDVVAVLAVKRVVAGAAIDKIAARPAADDVAAAPPTRMSWPPLPVNAAAIAAEPEVVVAVAAVRCDRAGRSRRPRHVEHEVHVCPLASLVTLDGRRTPKRARHLPPFATLTSTVTPPVPPQLDRSVRRHRAEPGLVDRVEIADQPTEEIAAVTWLSPRSFTRAKVAVQPAVKAVSG